MSHQNRRVVPFVVSLTSVLLALFTIAGVALAQSNPAELELFDFPIAADILLAYDPAAPDQSVRILPTDGAAIQILPATPFEQVSQTQLDPAAWETGISVALAPDDTALLRTTSDTLYKLAITFVPTGDIPELQTQFAPLPATLPDPAAPTTLLLNYYQGLEIETGDIFTDPTVASVIFCETVIVPTPTPTPGVIPEPGTAILLVLGVAGLLCAGLLRRRRNGPGMWLLLLLSVGLLVLGSVEYLTAQQGCLLLIEREGTGTGRVTGDEIDCGDVCRRSATDGQVHHFKAISDAGSEFAGWLVNGAPYQGLFHMQGDTVLTAIFDRIPNRAPVAELDAYTTPEETLLRIAAPGLLANDSDPDSDPLTVELVASPAHGSLTLHPDGSFEYRPTADFFGSDTFTYHASDGELTSDETTVTITVTPVNDQPIAVNDQYDTAEDTPLTIASPGVLSNDRDPDGDALTALLVQEPAHGSLTLNADGSFTYTPNAHFEGIDQCIYRVSDGEFESAIAVVTITVIGANDAPVAQDLSVTTAKNHPVALLLQGSDPDGDDLLYQLVDGPAHGTLNGSDNAFTYTPAADFLGQDQFTYLVNDGTLDSNIATVTILIQDIDLAITDVDVSQTIFDPYTMGLTGEVTVTWQNAGVVPVTNSYTVQVYIEDKQTNTTIELGTANVSTPLNPGETSSVVVSVSGTILFKDQLLYAFVDSADVIAEVNEDNNIAHTMAECEAQTPSTTYNYALEVNATANIFGSGHTALPGGGEFPPFINLPEGVGRVLTFSSVTGTVNCCGGNSRYDAGPDGQSIDSTDINSSQGISGIRYTGHALFLMGVFLADSEPMNPAPSRLDFTGAANFAELTPLLHQSFFIGDGLTGTGSGNIQQFHVPDNATRLYLGFADGWAFQGNPGYYSDNRGFLAASFTVSTPASCEDYTASFIRVDTTEYPNFANITVRIGNSGVLPSADRLTIAFYHGDPQTGGTLLGTSQTQTALEAGFYEDVTFTWNSCSEGLHTIYAVADDDGTGTGRYREADENNNSTNRTFPFTDQLPIADAGADQVLPIGHWVTLDGNNSYDPEGYEPLSYYWSILSAPDKSWVILNDPTTAMQHFRPDLPGLYLLELVVTNSLGVPSHPVQVTITVTPPNDPPIVSITQPYDGATYQSGDNILITADASDPDGQIVRVVFYAGTTIIGESVTPPYQTAWTPTQPGVYAFTARAYDNSGAWAVSQPITIVVPNRRPEITSEPAVVVQVGETYTYTVNATDPDGDILTYAAPTMPAGMTFDAATHVLSWTPTAAQVGTHPVRVTVDDGRGAGAGQSWTLHVIQPESGNLHMPEITSTPVQLALLGDVYTYDVEATDGDNDPLTYHLSNRPDGMTIDAASGLITWTPVEAQLGENTVTVLVDDGRGGVAGQYFNILAQRPNQPPTVSIGYPVNEQKVRVGDVVVIQAQASDADGTITTVEFTLNGAAIGTAATAPYEFTWMPTDIGAITLTATATDHAGATTTSAPVTVQVLEPLPDTEPPVVQLTVTPEQTTPGGDVTITVSVTDASAISSTTLTVNGTTVPLVDNQATYTCATAGFYTATATAIDAANNTGTATETFRAGDGSDTTPPVVDLHDDVELQCQELAVDLYDIIGSATDDSGQVHYTLQAKEKGCGAWETLAEGTNAVNNATLATFDPTIHRNGLFEVRLTAADPSGNTADVAGCLLVDGRFKAGQASIGGIDFNIPELGFPLLAGRVYDSRNTCEGGFGGGWSMPQEPGSVQADFTYDPSEGWGEEARGSFFTTYYLISRDRKVLVLRLGDGAVFKFKMDVNPKSNFMDTIMDNGAFPMAVSYLPVEETKGSLEALDAEPEVYLFSNNGGTLASWDGEAYNPQRFKLTLKDGTVYIISKDKGIESITDPYGHQISYSATGITHSSGDVLQIVRDTSNRIERIKDQRGRTVEYHYDAHGMLEKVVQPAESSFPMRVLEAYAYNMGMMEQPILKDIIAPDGTRLGTFEYDSAGRKTGLLDHNGNRVLFGYDAPSHAYTVTDRRGNPTSYTYDGDGNVTSITDAHGKTETYTYDAQGRIIAKTNKLGYTTSSTYDADGNVLTETDPLGNTMTYTYDSDGNRLTASDPLGNTAYFTYDAHGNVLTTEDALHHTSSFGYNADGLQTSATNALNQTTTFAYDGRGNMTHKTDPLGHSVSFTYDLYGHVVAAQDEMGRVTHKEFDPQGNEVQITDAAGHVTALAYHHSGKVTDYTDPAGQVTRNAFDPNGNLLRTTDPSGSTFQFAYDENEQPTVTTSTITTANGVETVEIEKVYDDLNRVTEQVDADGLSTKAEYDDLGRQTATIDKLGNRSQIQYDPRNLPTRSIGPDGRGESTTYDAAGRVATKTDAAGRTTAYEYDPVGNVTKTTTNGVWVGNTYDALGRMMGTTSSTGLTTSRTYDAAGRLLTETDVLGHTTQYEYYDDGKQYRIIDPRGNVTEYRYNTTGAVSAVVLPDGKSITYTYNDQGKKLAETDQLNHTTSFRWNTLGLLEQITDPLGHATSYTYNEIGNLLSQTDANTHTTTFEYNKLGRRTKKTYPLGMAQTISYDVDNRTTSVTDFNGKTIVSEYDQFGRVTRTSFPGGAALSYAYTTDGQLASVTDSRGTTTYTYDGEGRLQSRTDPDGATISYAYDSLGRRQSVTVPSGTTGYTYDQYGRLDTVTSPAGTTRYTYDQHGNKARVIYPNGITTSYGYDNLNRLITVETRNLTNDLLASYAYTLNSKGQRTRIVEGAGGPATRTLDYIYDAADRLIEERITDPVLGNRVISYAYDPVGNRLTKTDNGETTTSTYDENDRLLTAAQGGATETYTYDNNGNMLTKTGNGTQQQLTYNVLNQLVQANINATSVAYAYDHDGIRVSKTVNGANVTNYLVDNNVPYAQVVEEQWTRGAQNGVTRYTYGDALIAQSTNGVSNFYQYDGLGSTRSLTDATGALTDTYAYDAYGQLLEQTGASANPYLYRGEQYDPETDAYYLRARYYQPGIGRFMTTDPMGGFPYEPVSLHRYLYGNNDPINQVDPAGRYSLQDQAAACLIINTLVTKAVDSSKSLQDVYAALGELVFPDAYIVGYTIKGPFKFLEDSVKKVINSVFPIFDIGMPMATMGINSIETIGLELVMSIASAEAALFLVPGWDTMNRSPSFSVYRGAVFNLWNVNEYKGPFVSVNIGDWSFFGGPATVMKGPWGIAKSKTLAGDSFSSISGTVYIMRARKTYLHAKEIGEKTALLATLVEALMQIPNFSTTLPFPLSDINVGLASVMFQYTLWTQTATAKYYWTKNYGPTIQERQKPGSTRPKDFQSGPGAMSLSYFLE